MVSQTIRRERTATAILLAARRCFGEAGYSNTTIDDIAKAAKITKGGVYHHFTSKAHIFETVHANLSQELSLSVINSLKQETDLFEAVRTALNTFFKECHDPAIVKIIFRDGPIVLGEMRWREIDRKNFGGQIKDVLAMGMQTNLLQTHPLEPLANLFNSAINEAILQCIDADNFEESSQQYIDTIMLLLLGISIQQS